MYANNYYNSVILVFLGSSDQVHGFVDFGNFVGVKYLINDESDYPLSYNHLNHFVLRYINKIQVEEYIDLSGYVLQHKSIADIDLSNKSILSSELQKEIHNKYTDYCQYNKLDLHTGEPLTINRTGFSKKLKKFVQTIDDNTSENTQYYVFIKLEMNSEIIETLNFENYESFNIWIADSQIVWLV
jgi:hypothetical protein